MHARANASDDQVEFRLDEYNWRSLQAVLVLASVSCVVSNVIYPVILLLGCCQAGCVVAGGRGASPVWAQ
jgi:hypothetical protein